RATEKYYGEQKPGRPVVYLTDYPAGAFVTATGVKNSALDFRTCIYKSRDDIHFARPLGCFEWQNVYVYDFAQGKFSTEWSGFPAAPPPPLRPERLPLIVLAALFAALIAVALLAARRARVRF